jgi:hypothetical protein
LDELSSIIIDRLERQRKKTVEIPFLEQDWAELTRIAREMSTQDAPVAPEELAADAVRAYILRAQKLITKERREGAFKKTPAGPDGREQPYDTLVVPADPEGFQRVFLGEGKWRYARIQESRKGKIKYLAVYLTSPVGAISHYARVAEFIYRAENGKYEILLDGPAIQLERPVLRGDYPVGVRTTRYTQLNRLLAARELRDLWPVRQRDNLKMEGYQV